MAFTDHTHDTAIDERSTAMHNLAISNQQAENYIMIITSSTFQGTTPITRVRGQNEMLHEDTLEYPRVGANLKYVRRYLHSNGRGFPLGGGHIHRQGFLHTCHLLPLASIFLLPMPLELQPFLLQLSL